MYHIWEYGVGWLKYKMCACACAKRCLIFKSTHHFLLPINPTSTETHLTYTQHLLEPSQTISKMSTPSSITIPWKTDPSAGPIPAHIYFPTPPSSTPHPIALIFHAGGFVLGSTSLIPKGQISYLVSRGFVVVTPEYRLCPQVSLFAGPVQDAGEVLKWCQSALPALLQQQTSVAVDASRIVALGHSAGGTLALHTGLCASPPLAILDFYGPKCFDDRSWFAPLPVFAQMPDLPKDFTEQIHEGAQAVTSEAMFVAGKPNLKDARCAWYIAQIKAGTSLSSVVPDGNYQRCDPVTQFSAGFPPTYFLHGKEDVFVGYALSERAADKLRECGLATELMLGEEIGHAFDLQPGAEESESWGKYVVPALEWLVGKALSERN
jgi:acetyl esterase/lipase